MPRFDLSPAELATYAPEVREPADFDDFWNATIAASRQWDAAPEVTRLDTPSTRSTCSTSRSPASAGDPVKAWLLAARRRRRARCPRSSSTTATAAGAACPHERLGWAASGYAHLFMDTRGQGSGGAAGGVDARPARLRAGDARVHDAGHRRPARLLLPPGLHRRGARGRRRARRSRGWMPPASRCAAAARAAASRSRRPGSAGRPRRRDARRAVPLPLRARRRHDRRRPLRRDRAVPLRAPRSRRSACSDTLSYFDGVNMAKRAAAPALFSVGAARHDLPAVDRVRRVQPLRAPSDGLPQRRGAGVHPGAGPAPRPRPIHRSSPRALSARGRRGLSVGRCRRSSSSNRPDSTALPVRLTRRSRAARRPASARASAAAGRRAASTEPGSVDLAGREPLGRDPPEPRASPISRRTRTR